MFTWLIGTWLIGVAAKSTWLIGTWLIGTWLIGAPCSPSASRLVLPIVEGLEHPIGGPLKISLHHCASWVSEVSSESVAAPSAIAGAGRLPSGLCDRSRS